MPVAEPDCTEGAVAYEFDGRVRPGSIWIRPKPEGERDRGVSSVILSKDSTLRLLSPHVRPLTRSTSPQPSCAKPLLVSPSPDLVTPGYIYPRVHQKASPVPPPLPPFPSPITSQKRESEKRTRRKHPIRIPTPRRPRHRTAIPTRRRPVQRKSDLQLALLLVLVLGMWMVLLRRRGVGVAVCSTSAGGRTHHLCHLILFSILVLQTRGRESARWGENGGAFFLGAGEEG